MNKMKLAPCCMRLGYGGIFNDSFITYLRLSVTVKEF